MDKKQKKWRRLYTFACKTCKRTRAQTIRWNIYQAGRCRVCRGSARVSENQLPLFPSVIEQAVSSPLEIGSVFDNL